MRPSPPPCSSRFRPQGPRPDSPPPSRSPTRTTPAPDRFAKRSHQANNNADADTIAFNVSGAGCVGGICTITPATTYPFLTSPVTIDGYTQTGASPNTNAEGALNTALRIVISASAIPGILGSPGQRGRIDHSRPRFQRRIQLHDFCRRPERIRPGLLLRNRRDRNDRVGQPARRVRAVRDFRPDRWRPGPRRPEPDRRNARWSGPITAPGGSSRSRSPRSASTRSRSSCAATTSSSASAMRSRSRP